MKTIKEQRTPPAVAAQQPSSAAHSSSVKRSPPVEIERELEQLSRWMDNLFRIPGLGWRFGLDALAGLLPVGGDTATSLVSLYILASAVRYRVPKITLLRMGINIAADYVVGSVPVVGDLFDAWWKTNQRNIELLRRHATVSAAEARTGRTSDWLFVGGVILVLVLLLLGSLTVSYLILRAIFGNISLPW